jgi:hypothetical protein
MPQYSFDSIPTEVLIFGTNEQELTRITGLSANKNLRSYAIHFEEGISTRIGEKDVPMKLFKIDGRGGERIARIEVGMGCLPMSLKVGPMLTSSLYESSV